MGDFRDLIVWREAKDLAVDIYKHSNEGFNSDYRFKTQLTSAVVSISSNIAEGDELNSNKQSVRLFNISKGSCAEVKSLLIIGHDIDYFTNEEFEKLYQKTDYISRMLYKLIKMRKTS